VIAYQGQGPEDMDRPNRLDFIRSRVFVSDARGVAIFSPEGTFLARIRRSVVELNRVPTINGWFGLKGLTYLEEGRPLEAVVLDRSSSNEVVLASWSSEVSRGARFDYQAPRPVDPAGGLTLYRLDRDGRFAYVKPEGIERITVIDLENKVSLGEIEIEESPMPFDQEWGYAQLEAMRKMFREKGINAAISADFPDRFPLIHNFMVTAENRVAVALWSAARLRGDDEKELRVFDLRGNALEPNELDHLWFNLIHVDGDNLVLWCFNQELEEYTIGRCRRDELEPFLREYPLLDPADSP